MSSSGSAVCVGSLGSSVRVFAFHRHTATAITIALPARSIAVADRDQYHRRSYYYRGINTVGVCATVRRRHYAVRKSGGRVAN